MTDLETWTQLPKLRIRCNARADRTGLHSGDGSPIWAAIFAGVAVGGLVGGLLAKYVHIDDSSAQVRTLLERIVREADRPSD